MAAWLLLVGCEGQITSPQTSGGPERTEEYRAEAVTPPLTVSDFTSASTCSACHPGQATQWQSSSHAHAMTDPIFQALVNRAREESAESAELCLSCHSKIGALTGALDVTRPFSASDAVLVEGVTCEGCHRMTEVSSPRNAAHRLDPFAPMQGSIHAENRSPYHATEKSSVLATSELCGSCHDVESNAGVSLEQPYAEWTESPARAEGLVCIDCHMPKEYGIAAPGYDLPERPLRRHTWLGPGQLTANTRLDPAALDQVTIDVRAQLQSALGVALTSAGQARPGSPITVRLALESRTSGHRLPTGSAFFRQLWIALTVEDRTGRVIFEVDPDRAVGEASPATSALLLSARLFDATGLATPFPWRALRLESNALNPLEKRSIEVAFQVPGEARGPLLATARLKFRTFAPDLIEQLGLPPHLSITLDVQAAEATIALAEDP